MKRFHFLLVLVKSKKWTQNHLPERIWMVHQKMLATHSLLFISLLELKLSAASRASWDPPWWRWTSSPPPLSAAAALYGLVYFAEILSFLPATQHTRWDSWAHTVTQAFRHSLAPTNTISVTFHYMVLGWISGLETHQISTQGALPPHPPYCLSVTMSNCFLFALFMPKI